jgi:hypothetical protein
MIKSKRLTLVLALGLAITVTPALAATKSSTPTPKVSTAKKITPTPKASTATKSPTPTPKVSPTKKAPVKKAPVKKKKKLATLSPSPSPKWPPVGFKTDPLGEPKMYLKVPNTKELIGILSAKTALASQIKDCTKFTCGAVIVASETGCRWWKVTGDVVGATSAEDRTLKTFGTVAVSVTRSAAKQLITILMVTPEPIGSGQIVTKITAYCNQSEPTGSIPNTEYQKSAGE